MRDGRRKWKKIAAATCTQRSVRASASNRFKFLLKRQWKNLESDDALNSDSFTKEGGITIELIKLKIRYV